MSKPSIDDIRSILSEVKVQMSTLRGYMGDLNGYLSENKMIPNELASSLERSLKECREKEELLREAASALNLSTDDPLDRFQEEVDRLQDAEETKNLQQIIHDYYRLTAVAEETLKVLDETKHRLKRICEKASENLKDEVKPYRLVVEHIRSREDLTDEEYDLVGEALGRTIVRAVDRQQVTIDANADISHFLSDSIAQAASDVEEEDLLSAEHTNEQAPDEAEPIEAITEERPESESIECESGEAESEEEDDKTQTVEVKAQSDPTEESSDNSDVWHGFSGYVDDTIRVCIENDA